MNILFIPNKNFISQKSLLGRVKTFPPDACVYYRLVLPAKYMGEQSILKNEFHIPIQYIHLPDGTKKPVSIKVLSQELHWAEIVVFQRHYDDNGMVGTIASWCRDRGKTIIYETDDNLELVDQIKYHEGEVAKIKLGMKFVEWIIKNADAITTTTDFLKNELSKHTTKPIYVLPNSIDPADWKKKKKKNKKVRIGWAGSKTHLQDLEILKEPLKRIKEKYKDKIEIVFLSNLKGLEMPFEFECHPAVLITDYPSTLQSLNLDIGLAPLKAMDFNRCRSNIKWIEYSMAGVATIATDIETYKDITGILTKNTPEGWYGSLETLIENESKRRNLADEARQKVLDEYNIKKNAKLWKQVYQKVSSRKKKQQVSQ